MIFYYLGQQSAGVYEPSEHTGLWPVITSANFLTNGIIFAGALPSSGLYMTTHIFQKVQFLDTEYKRKQSLPKYPT